MARIWIATGNAHKKEEFEQMLPGVEVKTLADLKEYESPAETGTTFEENALIKARSLYQAIHEPVIADDSGLEVDALGKAPGVYSSRFMGEETPYSIKNQAIINAVEGKEGKERAARFVCVIAYIDENGEEHIYRGTMEGEIAHEIIGEHGFGYDPIFFFPPFGTTSANVPAEQKNAHSHRGNALRLFLEDWENMHQRQEKNS